MNFSSTQHLLSLGKVMTRKGWNGSGQFVWWVPPGDYPARMEAIKDYFPDNMVPYDGYYALCNAQGKVVPWAPSMGDLQAEDWQEVTLPRAVPKLSGKAPQMVILDELASLDEYRCHKVVSAGKIARITAAGTDAILHLEKGGQLTVSKEYWGKHAPEVGGYYVEYADGYASYSPAKAFEEGYSLAKTEPTTGSTQGSGYEMAQRRQHLADLISQLSSSARDANGALTGTLGIILQKLAKELNDIL